MFVAIILCYLQFMCPVVVLCLCSFWVLVINELYALGMFHRITLLFAM